MIELQHIEVTYGDHPILRGLDAQVAEGRITAVMGPNGCGKTTLLRCIGGLLRPNGGQVLVDGRPVQTYTARQLAQQVAFVRQQAQTDFDFSAFEIVLMGRNPYQHHLQNESQADWDIVERCMRQTGTWHLRLARPAELSGGELQRVMIARALAQETPVLLMDEPVSNLDIAHQLEVMRLLRTAGKTTIIVIHDLNLALHYCDDVLLLHEGGMLFHGPIAEGLTPDRIATVYGVTTHLTDGQVVFDYDHAL
ncbi:MAG: ABC transporter ATP-binding protein [Bacteroidales bacterium]|nr:ABC transporter ATP-binding protein [Bacteroidales bacterium]